MPNYNYLRLVSVLIDKNALMHLFKQVKGLVGAWMAQIRMHNVPSMCAHMSAAPPLNINLKANI